MKKLKSHVFVATIAIVAATGSASAADFSETAAPVGRNGDLLVTPVNQVVTSAGKFLELPGMRPQALALSPDGKILVTAGLTHELLALDPGTGEVLQRVALPPDKGLNEKAVASAILNPDEKGQMSYSGLTFSPDGTRIFMSSINGDVKVFSVGHDHQISPLGSIALPAVTTAHRTLDIATGIAVSPDGKMIYVAGNLSNRVFEFDAMTGKLLRAWDVGVAPFDVVLAGKKLYVSNWGGRRPNTNSVVGPAGLGTRVRVDARSVASEGSVSVIDLAANAVELEIVVGPHASAMALAPNGRWLVVASSGTDMLSVFDTRADALVDMICARQSPSDLFGAQPDALAFDRSGRTLYCANATQNAVAVFHFRSHGSELRGLIPVGWFPSGLAYDARRKQICVANLKDIATRTQKARQGATGYGFNTHQYAGSLSLVPNPSRRQLAAYTQTVLKNLRYPLLAQAALPARPGVAPAPVPERVGEPSVFKHVIYIIKENRSYDQVMGDVTNGNGDAALCTFGEYVTPNEHKLVRDFTLLDNTFCCGILSADGHNWTDSALANDYLERSFAGWIRSYPAGGDGEGGADALAYASSGFIWTDAREHGQTVWNLGEFTTTSKHWRDPNRKGKIGFAESWNNFTNGSDAIEYTCEPDIESLRPFTEKEWCSWDLNVPDVVRAAMFVKKLKGWEASGEMPALTIFWLPNDHTSGTRPGGPTPQAQVADNDLAMGQVMDAVSHSKFWKDTCIFAIEDDPQNGWDHVSGYRTTAYVVSPYTKRHAVVNTQYNSTSLLRTIELMLGLPPMNQFDATATPMFDCFTNVPDFAAYDAVTNNVPLTETNPSPKKIKDAQLRHDAYVSARLPLDKADQCNEDVLNRILWRATMGSRPYPEWAVKPAVDED